MKAILFSLVMAVTLGLATGCKHTEDPKPACNAPARPVDKFNLTFKGTSYAIKYKIPSGGEGPVVDQAVTATAMIALRNGTQMTVKSTSSKTDRNGQTSFVFSPTAQTKPEAISGIMIQFFVKYSDGTIYQTTYAPGYSDISIFFNVIEPNPPASFDTQNCKWNSGDTYTVPANKDIVLEASNPNQLRVGH